MSVDTPPSEPEYERLAELTAGAVLRLGDGGYGEARSVWNAMVDREPAVVVRPVGAADVIVEYAERAPIPQSEILIHQLDGAINDVAPDATAYPHRDAGFAISVAARWTDPATDDECIARVRACHDALANRSTGGTYVNFEGDREGRERNAYAENYDRLVEVKTRCDPANLFRLNQNVAPAERPLGREPEP